MGEGLSTDLEPNAEPHSLLLRSLEGASPSILSDLWDVAQEPKTYDLRKNGGLILGFFFGLPLPLITTSLTISIRGSEISEGSILKTLVEGPAAWFFLAHPLFFGLALGLFYAVVRKRGQRVEELLKRLRSEAETDVLTKLLTRRALMRSLEAEMERSRREETALSMIMLDLDRFKRLNDEHGHLGGDAVLREVSRRIRSSLRSYDQVGRYGGEEILVLLPGTPLEEALAIGERIRRLIGDEPVSLPDGPASVTLSGGVARFLPGESLSAWIDRADVLLYRAKAEGRNRVLAALGSAQTPSSSVS